MSERNSSSSVDHEAKTLACIDRPSMRTDSTLGTAATAAGSSDSSASRTRNAIGEWSQIFEPSDNTGDLGMLAHYRIVELIGRGGMGCVFRAIDTHLQRTVAIKVIARQSEQASERFLREGRALAAVASDHVVTIFQVGQSGEVLFLVMEYLEGWPLSDLLHGANRLAIPQILRLGREAAQGLAATHEKGLVHRDIKPDNLWVTAKGMRLKILDFGVARDLVDDERLTQEGSVLGTPLYMAPEQADGGAVDARCDLFALGCVLYLLCTGDNPFRGKSAFEILKRVAIDTPPSPRATNPRVPEELSDLIDQLLSKEPDDRPATATVVAARLAAMEEELGETCALDVPLVGSSSLVKTKPIRRVDAAKKGAPPAEKQSRWHLVHLALLLLALVLLAFIAFRPPPRPHHPMHPPPHPWELNGDPPPPGWEQRSPHLLPGGPDHLPPEERQIEGAPVRSKAFGT